MSQLPDPFDNLEIVEALFIMQRPYVGMSQLNRLNEIIAKYPEYFPWETKYRETPKEVHEAFRKEAYPSIYEERPIEFTGGIGGGIMDQIKKSTYTHPPKEPFNLVKAFEEAMNKQIEEERNQAKEEARVKAIWDKHYKPYNIEYRP